jgi:acetoin utilization deacetylase AcuC-like enzyme
MQVTEVGFGWMGRKLREVADETAGSRLGLVLEGGYDLSAIEESTAASLRGALGWPVPEPPGDAGVSDLHREAIEAAKPGS